MKEQSLAMTLIDEIRSQSKRKDKLILLLIIAWLTTIGVFILYINQFDYSSESVATMETDNSGSITTGDIDNG